MALAESVVYAKNATMRKEDPGWGCGWRGCYGPRGGGSGAGHQLVANVGGIAMTILFAAAIGDLSFLRHVGGLGEVLMFFG